MKIYRLSQISDSKPSMPELHKQTPLSSQQLQEVISDVIKLYPETEQISVAGTYARVSEEPSNKSHDVDILVYIPKGINPYPIIGRDDSNLWRKWDHVPIDFIMKYGDHPEWMVGQHLSRIEEGKPTPEIVIWRK